MGSSAGSASDDESIRGSRIKKADDDRTAIRSYTLIIFPLMWGFGLVSSRLRGCDTDLALTKATAYALSGLVGWGTCLLIRWRSPSNRPWLFGGAWGANSLMLGPTVTPQPFREMLAFGLIGSVLMGLLMGLLYRFVFDRFLSELAVSGKAPGRSSDHPLSDEQVG